MIEKAGAGRYTVRLQGVLLDASSKENKVRLWVSNEEKTMCLEPGSLDVPTARVLPSPIIRIVEPEGDLNVVKPEISIKIRVESVSPLESVRILREGREPLAIPLPAEGIKPDKDGVYLLTVKTVPLNLGPNPLHAEAVTASGARGSTREPRIVNFHPPPVEVFIDRLVEIKAQGKDVAAKRLPRGKIVFPQVEQGHVRLYGRLKWTNKENAREERHKPVRIFVNGFQQVPVPGRLDPARIDELERSFEADLFLNRKENNQVQVLVSGQELQFDVQECREPIAKQRLAPAYPEPASER